MNTRTELNAANLLGGLVLAGSAGLATGSWGMFPVGTGVLLALDWYMGNIRPRGPGE